MPIKEPDFTHPENKQGFSTTNPGSHLSPDDQLQNGNNKLKFQTNSYLLAFLHEQEQLITSLRYELRRNKEELSSIHRSVFGHLFRLYKALRKPGRQRKQKRKNDYSAWLLKYDRFTLSRRRLIAGNIRQMQSPPLISLLMPVIDPDPAHLQEAISSIRKQVYTRWQLCIACHSDTNHELRLHIKHQASEECRIIVVNDNQNPSSPHEALISWLEHTRDTYVALMGEQDRLHPLALYHMARESFLHSDAELFFSDEDSLDEHGKRCHPHFKPDFNYDLLLCQDIIGSLVMYRKSLIIKAGGFSKAWEESRDYDLALRAIELLRPEQIRHIPNVLYHKRGIGLDKTCCTAASRESVQRHLDRRGIAARVDVADGATEYNRIRYQLPVRKPTVDILIPTKDQVTILKTCIYSLLLKTAYPCYTITIIDNGSCEKETLSFFQAINQNSHIRIIHDDRPFNYSRLNNLASSTSSAEYLCLMNNDIEVISPDWLSEMLSHAIQPDVGAVGAKLWYPDGRLQHNGIILGPKGGRHINRFLEKEQKGYYCRDRLQQSFSALTGACLLVGRSKFATVGGLNEEHLSISYNDVELCLKLLKCGYRNVWTPYAELYHHESVSRGYDITPEKKKRVNEEYAFLYADWKNEFDHDPAYNPNLTINANDCSLAWPPRINKNTP